MRSDHPENCSVTYELMFNGMTRNLSRISMTQISQMTLTDVGFPFCKSTSVSVIPHLPAHGAIQRRAVTTTYLAIPSKTCSSYDFMSMATTFYSQ